MRKVAQLQSYGTIFFFFFQWQTKTKSYKETKKRSYKATERGFYPYSLTLLVLSWYPHQSESHQLSLNEWLTHGVTDGHPDPKIGPQVFLGPIKIHTSSNLEHFRPIFPMFDLQCTIFLIQKKSFETCFPFPILLWHPEMKTSVWNHNNHFGKMENPRKSLKTTKYEIWSTIHICTYFLDFCLLSSDGFYWVYR